MAGRQRSRVAAAYQARVAAIHAAIDTRIRALYVDVDPDAIEQSIDDFIARAEPVIAAGQASVAELVAAYVRTASGDLVDAAGNVEAIVGTTRQGASLVDGMAAFGSMILGQIADGKSVDDAMQFGESLATRFADSEVTGAGDRQIDVLAAVEVVTGWEGVVSPEACDACQSNAGRHELDEEIYRHPWCNCQRLPIFG